MSMKRMLALLRTSILGGRTISSDRLAELAVTAKLAEATGLRSTLFFTHHKCASTFINRFLMRMDNAIAGLRSIDYCNFFWKLEDRSKVMGSYALDDNAFLNEMMDSLFQERGFIYGPLRYPLEICHDTRFTRIVFLRDPRDTLVSFYHSVAHSHPLPADPRLAKTLLNLRHKSLSQGIDSFVIEQAETWLGPLLQKYRNLVADGGSHIHLFLYEDLVENPENVVGNMLRAIAGPPCNRLMHEILRHETFLQNGSNDGCHQRSGRTGQFRDELSRFTVARVERLFQNELEFFWGGRSAPLSSAA